MTDYEIKAMEEPEKLQEMLLDDYIEIAGREYVHKNGFMYRVVNTILINFDGKCHRSVIYCPVSNGIINSKIRFCRPLKEFLDGRFKEVEE